MKEQGAEATDDFEAVRQYPFKPASEDGKPVKVDLTLDGNFQTF